MLVIGKGSIESRVKEEAHRRAIDRRNEAVLSGLTRDSGPKRGDFKACRETDKIMRNYKEVKNPNDRKKITQEFYQAQKEYRKP